MSPAALACRWVYVALNNAIGQPLPWYRTLLQQFQTNLLLGWDALRNAPEFTEGFTFDTLLALLTVNQDLETLIEKLLAFSFEDLRREVELPDLPLADKTYLRLDGVYRVHIPERPGASCAGAAGATCGSPSTWIRWCSPTTARSPSQS